MLQNLKNDAYIYYMLSNNHLNTLIVHDFDLSDENLVGWYISLVKTIALKLDTNTVQFFYNRKLNGMPLLTECIKFYKNKDRNVRIAIRTITLQVLKVEEANVQKFVLDQVARTFFANLLWHVCEEAKTLDKVFATATTKKSGELETLAAEHLDRLFYISDVFSTAQGEIREVLRVEMLYRFLLPILVASIPPKPCPAGQEDMEMEGRLSPMMAMMFLAQTIFICSDPPLVNAAAAAVLCTSTSTEGVASPVLQAVLSALQAQDDRVVLAGLSLLLAIFDRTESGNDPVDAAILQYAQIAPCAADPGSDEKSSPPPVDDNAAVQPALIDLVTQLEHGIAGAINASYCVPPPPLVAESERGSTLMEAKTVDGVPKTETAELATGPNVLEVQDATKADAPESSASLDMLSWPTHLQTSSIETSESNAVGDLLANQTIDVLCRGPIVGQGDETTRLRIVVLQVAARLLCKLREHASGEEMVDTPQLARLEGALEEASKTIRKHLDDPDNTHKVYIFVREEIRKMEQRRTLCISSVCILVAASN